MRIRFVVPAVVVGCLAYLLGLGPARTQNPPAPPAGRKRPPRLQRPAAAAAPAPTSDAPPNPNEVDERFRRLDRNGDGVLSPIEMTENLRAELHKWDVNGDSMIDLNEWRAYVAAVREHQGRMADSKKAPRGPGKQSAQRPPFKKRGRKPLIQSTAARPPFNESRPSWPTDRRARVTAPKVHNVPSNVPVWFKEYDTDGDGQVSLHEWHEKEDEERDFWKYDLNKDGLITLDELIRTGQFIMDKNKPMPQRGVGFRAQPGEFFYIEVTGAIGGGVWGTDIYTIDSLISTAAVHAGLVRVGETRFLKLTILPGQTEYHGTTRNGVTTASFGGFRGSYRLEEIPR